MGSPLLDLEEAMNIVVTLEYGIVLEHHMFSMM